MNTARGAKTIRFHILLVALTIQGVTPAADDLASPWLIRQFGLTVRPEAGAPVSPVSSLASARQGEGIPPSSQTPDPRQGEEREESTTEICTLAELLRRGVQERVAVEFTRLTDATPRRLVRLAGFDLLRTRTRDLGRVEPAAPAESLVRMSC